MRTMSDCHLPASFSLCRARSFQGILPSTNSKRWERTQVWHKHEKSFMQKPTIWGIQQYEVSDLWPRWDNSFFHLLCFASNHFVITISNAKTEKRICYSNRRFHRIDLYFIFTLLQTLPNNMPILLTVKPYAKCHDHVSSVFLCIHPNRTCPHAQYYTDATTTPDAANRTRWSVSQSNTK